MKIERTDYGYLATVGELTQEFETIEEAVEWADEIIYSKYTSFLDERLS